MERFTVLACKQVLMETEIEAENRDDAMLKAKNLTLHKFSDLDSEKIWKIKGIYQNNDT